MKGNIQRDPESFLQWFNHIPHTSIFISTVQLMRLLHTRAYRIMFSPDSFTCRCYPYTYYTLLWKQLLPTNSFILTYSAVGKNFFEVHFHFFFSMILINETDWLREWVGLKKKIGKIPHFSWDKWPHFESLSLASPQFYLHDRPQKLTEYLGCNLFLHRELQISLPAYKLQGPNWSR